MNKKTGCKESIDIYVPGFGCRPLGKIEERNNMIIFYRPDIKFAIMHGLGPLVGEIAQDNIPTYKKAVEIVDNILIPFMPHHPKEIRGTFDEKTGRVEILKKRK